MSSTDLWREKEEENLKSFSLDDVIAFFLEEEAKQKKAKEALKKGEITEDNYIKALDRMIRVCKECLNLVSSEKIHAKLIFDTFTRLLVEKNGIE